MGGAVVPDQMTSTNGTLGEGPCPGPRKRPTHNEEGGEDAPTAQLIKHSIGHSDVRPVVKSQRDQSACHLEMVTTRMGVRETMQHGWWS
ncbi:MAG: hypothetical protein RL430_2021 [Actinomycetota bacterium]